MSVINKINVNNVSYEIGNSSLTTMTNIEVQNDDSVSDLNIGDENGNVIAQFKEGHIVTKNFDSRENTNQSSGVVNFPHQLDNLKVIIVGDSITVGQGLSNPSTERWGNRLAEKYNWNLILDAAGGIPLATNSTNRTSIVTKLESNLKSIENPDLIIIWGGHNDTSYQSTPFGEFNTRDKTTFCGVIEYIADICKKYAPNARVFILTLIYAKDSRDSTYMTLSPDKTVRDMDNAIRIGAERNGMFLVDMSKCGINYVNGVSGNMTIDSIHPNVKGTNQIVAYLSRVLEREFVKYVSE